MKKLICLASVLLLLLAGCGSAEQSTETAAAAPETAAPAETAAAETAGESASAASEIGEDEEFSAEAFVFDTYSSLAAYGPGAEEALNEITARMTELDAMLSVTDENSEIYAIDHAEGQAAAASDVTRKLITFAQQLGEQTDNALDISIYPVTKAWGFTTEEYRIPSDEEIASLLTNVDESRIVVDDTAGTVQMPEGMELDLGALVKGYASDEAADILEENGVEHALLNMGASTIRVIGTKPDGSQWRVAVQDPEDDTTYAGVLSVSDCVVDTSGGYERYFMDDAGNIYWHIIDPATGKPADSGIISATIISDSGLLGDSMSTAAFVMGVDRTIDYWKTYGGFEFVLITEDHNIVISEGAADLFEPLYNYENAEITVVSAE